MWLLALRPRTRALPTLLSRSLATMPPTTLRFGPAVPAAAASAPAHTVVLGPRALLAPPALAPFLPGAAEDPALAAVAAGAAPHARVFADGGRRTVSFAALAENAPRARSTGALRADLVHKLVAAHVPEKEDVQLHVLLSGPEQATAAASAIARAFPEYSRKSDLPPARTVHVSFSAAGADLPAATYASLDRLAHAVRLAQRLTDTPTSELDTTAFVAEVRRVAARHAGTVKATVIQGEALLEHGLRALHGVGRAAAAPPALAVLEYTPAGHDPATANSARLALVGKGIVYDTGGLALKSPANMCDMKTDCGGAAALLGAFDALAGARAPVPLLFVGCLAENAVGPLSQRNDDVVVALSGLSVEINNTDAEGRLVLADGVAWAAKEWKPSHVLDMATLTGAQMITTGMHHGAVLSRSAAFEAAVLNAGQRSGDWAHPLLYAPELLLPEFESKVADMKNSVRSRTNAQASCAGHFVERHLPADWEGEWAHVDIAGPSFRDGRATGYGVALVVELAQAIAEGKA